jgi:hypothetical protein
MLHVPPMRQASAPWATHETSMRPMGHTSIYFSWATHEPNIYVSWATHEPNIYVSWATHEPNIYVS